MRPETKQKFNALQIGMAKKYAVQTVVEMFSVTVPQAIALVDAIMQSDAFLSRISMIPVTDSKGAVIMLHAPTTVAGRTDTSGAGERVPQQIGGNKTERTYEVKQTNFDVAVKYATLDAYARFPDFNARLLNMILRRTGLDRLLIGWYGSSCAADTDRAANPLLQDVNHGWLYDLETNKAANFVKAAQGQKLQLGKGGDWKNLDHLAFDLLSLIPEEHRTGNETVIVGRQIISWESGKIFAAHGHTPSEKINFEVMAKTYGGLPATMPAGFPDTGVMVCDPINLQLYWQDSSVRRQLIDNPKKDQIEHFQNSNECYRIGDLDACAAVKAADIEFIDNPDDSVKIVNIGNWSEMPVAEPAPGA
ncbi:MAG: phage major capsid protein, P2 family [Lentisphaerota bacterium]